MLILEKKDILGILRIIFQKNGIISDVIIPTAAIFEIFFYHFFCNITKYDCVKHPLQGMIKQKYPRADRVNLKPAEQYEWEQCNIFRSMCEKCSIYKIIWIFCGSSSHAAC